MANPKLVAALTGAIIVTIGVTSIVLIATSLKKLSSDQIGLVYDTINKDIDTEAKTEGLHMGPPGFEFIIFPSVYKTLSFDNLQCLNADRVIITLDVTYQYKAHTPKIYEIVMNFKDYDGYKRVLKYTVESAIHESCSSFTTVQFQTMRGTFQEELRDNIEEKCLFLSSDITDIQVRNITRPREYELALRNKERAREDIQVAFNERPTLISEAEKEKREANVAARNILEKANSDARILKARAAAEAEAITQQYETELEGYQEILSSSGLELTVDEFLDRLYELYEKPTEPQIRRRRSRRRPRPLLG